MVSISTTTQIFVPIWQLFNFTTNFTPHFYHRFHHKFYHICYLKIYHKLIPQSTIIIGGGSISTTTPIFVPIQQFFYYTTTFYHIFYHICYHKFYHKPLPLFKPTPTIFSIPKRNTGGLHRFWGGYKDLAIIVTEQEEDKSTQCCFRFLIIDVFCT